MPPQKVRIFLAEDHELVRAGLKLLIEAQPDLSVVGEASDGVVALERIAELQPDLAIIDLSMPRMNGIELTSHVRGLAAPPLVLTLTANEDAAYLRQLLLLGVSGYLLKKSAADDLIQAIRTVVSGERYVAPYLIGHLVGQLAARVPLEGAVEALSDREQSVLRMIAQGLTNREIGEQLEISIKTVETYKMRAMQKAHLQGRAEIVRFAVAQGWLRD